jgi:hypothetical protein
MGDGSCVISGSVVEFTVFVGWNGSPSLSGAWKVQFHHNVTLFKLQVIEISTESSAKKKEYKITVFNNN